MCRTLVHADIFFFISSIGFVVVTFVALVGLVYIISILRRVDRITKKIETGITTMEEHTREFISDLRESMVFRVLFGGRKKRRTTEGTKSDNE